MTTVTSILSELKGDVLGCLELEGSELAIVHLEVGEVVGTIC